MACKEGNNPLNLITKYKPNMIFTIKLNKLKILGVVVIHPIKMNIVLNKMEIFTLSKKRSTIILLSYKL